MTNDPRRTFLNVTDPQLSTTLQLPESMLSLMCPVLVIDSVSSFADVQFRLTVEDSGRLVSNTPIATVVSGGSSMPILPEG